MEFAVDLLRGVMGIVILIFACYLLSSNKSAIQWRQVIIGIGLQVLLAILLLKVPFINAFFDIIAEGFEKVLRFSAAGAEFLFAGLVTDMNSFGYIFAFQVLPTIVFFSALSAILYYFGILQKVVYALAWIMSRTMGLSGPESLAAAANVFIGQTEAPLVVKPYLENMSRSEIMCLMTGGMATIAGGVFAAYIGFLGGDDPVMRVYFAKHLLTASLISAPAAIVAAKILVPELVDKPIERQLKMSDDKANNLLDAISIGTTDGLKLAVNVGVMLLVFTSLIALANWILSGVSGGISSLTGGFEAFNFTDVLGVLFAPVAWIIGTPAEDIFMVGELLGQKTVINEFIAYAEMEKIKSELSPKSLLIATYALCGFANFASIGIQIGGIGAIAPGQRKNITELGIKALIAGTVACLLTACIAGFMY